MNFEPSVMTRVYSYDEMRQELNEFEILGIKTALSEEYDIDLIYTSHAGCSQLSPSRYFVIHADKHNDDGEYEDCQEVEVSFFTLTNSGILIAVGYDPEDSDEQDQIIVRMC